MHLIIIYSKYFKYALLINSIASVTFFKEKLLHSFTLTSVDTKQFNCSML